MNYYNIKITIVDNYECSGYVVVDKNNLIYGNASCVDGPIKITGKLIENIIYLELEFEHKLVPIEGKIKKTDNGLLIIAKDLKDVQILIEMIDLDIIKDNLNCTKFRNCSNCYYGNYSTNGYEDSIWCESTFADVTPEHCCDEHLFCDENHEIDFEDYKRKQGRKIFVKMFNDKSVEK